MALSFLTLWAKRLLFDPKYANVLALLILLGDGVLTELIIAFVPCVFFSLVLLVHFSDLLFLWKTLRSTGRRTCTT